MEQDVRQKKLNDLYALIASIDRADDCRALFEDLCTVKAVENMAER